MEFKYLFSRYLQIDKELISITNGRYPEALVIQKKKKSFIMNVIVETRNPKSPKKSKKMSGKISTFV